MNWGGKGVDLVISNIVRHLLMNSFEIMMLFWVKSRFKTKVFAPIMLPIMLEETFLKPQKLYSRTNKETTLIRGSFILVRVILVPKSFMTVSTTSEAKLSFRIRNFWNISLSMTLNYFGKYPSKFAKRTTITPKNRRCSSMFQKKFRERGWVILYKISRQVPDRRERWVRKHSNPIVDNLYN